MNYSFLLSFLIVMFLLSPYYASSQEPDDADTLIEDLELLIEYLNLAESYYLENEIQTALSFYDNALEIDPSSIDALNGKANILNEIGQYEEAITYYNQVLEIDPSDIDALNGINASLEAIGEFQADNLAENLELLVEYLEQAETNFLENNFEIALRFYDNALEIDPSSIDALNGKANILNEIGQYEEAITYYNQVLEIDPSDIDALNGKANSLNALENHQEAITYYDKVLEMDSVNILALNGKALALESLGNVTEAVLLLEQIIELSEIEQIEEPQIVEENSPDLNNETFQGLDQTLIVIVGVFVVILGVIITLDLLVRKRTKKQSLEKSN